MNLTFERIQSTGNRYLNDVIRLYLESFPREERRDLNSLLSMLEEKMMFFTAILKDGHLAGMVIYWRFEGFLYIEHLAVVPRCRGEGIGSRALEHLQKLGDPILLEVENPHDAASKKRVAFYNKAGFRVLNINYLQPPYRKGELPLPMQLYSDRTVWEPEVLDRIIREFQSKVYPLPLPFILISFTLYPFSF